MTDKVCVVCGRTLFPINIFNTTQAWGWIVHRGLCSLKARFMPWRYENKKGLRYQQKLEVVND